MGFTKIKMNREKITKEREIKVWKDMYVVCSKGRLV